MLALSYEARPRPAPQALRRIGHETIEGFRALWRYRDAAFLVGLGLAQTLTRGFLNVFLALAALGLVAPLVAGLLWRRLAAIDRSITHRDEEVEVLQRVGILRPLPMPAIDNLAAHVARAHFDAGDEVFLRLCVKPTRSRLTRAGAARELRPDPRKESLTIRNRLPSAHSLPRSSFR